MNKQQFLDELRRALRGLPESEVNERLGFYSEMIDDRIEEGLSEEEAVAEIGPISEITSQILSDIPLTRIVKEKISAKQKSEGWKTVLLILGFPLWFSLLAAGFAIVVSLYAVIWSVAVALWAVEISLVAGAVAGIAASVVYYIQGFALAALAASGITLFLIGFSIVMFYCFRALTGGIVKLSKGIALGIKSLFIGKER